MGFDLLVGLLHAGIDGLPLPAGIPVGLADGRRFSRRSPYNFTATLAKLHLVLIFLAAACATSHGISFA
jgi:hypothetical protein